MVDWCPIYGTWEHLTSFKANNFGDIGTLRPFLEYASIYAFTRTVSLTDRTFLNAKAVKGPGE